jgi:DNA-binding transcriptional ArsR family regulator
MVERLDATFAALSDATRRHILARLARGEASVGEIAAPYEMSLNAVSKHLMALESARLITRRVEGRVHYLRLNPAPLREASDWLAFYRAFWEARLDALELFLDRKKGAPHGARTAPRPADRRRRS